MESKAEQEIICAKAYRDKKCPRQKDLQRPWERHWYQPDVILRDSNNEVRCIIEIENDPVRKVLVGASILADYSVRKLNQETRPRLIFVVYTEQGIKQIPNLIEKLAIAKQYCSYLGDIEIYSEKNFKAAQV